MDTPYLNSKDIFAVKAGELFGTEDDKVQIIYAPLGGHVALATKAEVEEMERHTTDKADAQIADFQAKGGVTVYHMPKHPEEVFQIDLLLNFTCNFKCIYCYSAQGRSNKEAAFEDVKTVIDYLFLSGRKQPAPYIINFSGGGEPLMSFPLMKRVIEYIESVAENTDYKYSIGLVTNGSLITPEITDFFKSHNIDMAVSFEILQELQDKERGSYDKVASNIDMMLEKGYLFGIRTTFTPDSVARMEDMVEEVAKRFPRLKKMVYDVVLAPSLFPTVQSLDNYYDAFIDGFYKSKAKAAEYGITLESIAVELLSITRDRTCQGKIVLTPHGHISSCARVSSPVEKHYEDYVFGSTAAGTLSLDNESFAEIMQTNNIHTKQQCHNCFARWNCGGGCRLFDQNFTEDYQEARCRFVRKALRRQLYGILCNNYGEERLQNLVRNSIKG